MIAGYGCALAAVAMSLFLIPVSAAPAAESFAVGFYKSLESKARVDFKETVASFNAAKDARVKAGKVVVTPLSERQAMSGLQLMIYTKYAVQGICADLVDPIATPKPEVAVDECYRQKMTDFIKWQKLSDYAGEISTAAMSRCEARSRDFDNEIRFPPYAFLIGERAPVLFDFARFNKCIQDAL